VLKGELLENGEAANGPPRLFTDHSDKSIANLLLYPVEPKKRKEKKRTNSIPMGQRDKALVACGINVRDSGGGSAPLPETSLRPCVTYSESYPTKDNVIKLQRLYSPYRLQLFQSLSCRSLISIIGESTIEKPQVSCPFSYQLHTPLLSLILLTLPPTSLAIGFAIALSRHPP
jgi:hypothetical protein